MDARPAENIVGGRIGDSSKLMFVPSLGGRLRFGLLAAATPSIIGLIVVAFIRLKRGLCIGVRLLGSPGMGVLLLISSLSLRAFFAARPICRIREIFFLKRSFSLNVDGRLTMISNHSGRISTYKN